MRDSVIAWAWLTKEFVEDMDFEQFRPHCQENARKEAEFMIRKKYHLAKDHSLILTVYRERIDDVTEEEKLIHPSADKKLLIWVRGEWEEGC